MQCMIIIQINNMIIPINILTTNNDDESHIGEGAPMKVNVKVVELVEYPPFRLQPFEEVINPTSPKN